LDHAGRWDESKAVNNIREQHATELELEVKDQSLVIGCLSLGKTKWGKVIANRSTAKFNRAARTTLREG